MKLRGYQSANMNFLGNQLNELDVARNVQDSPASFSDTRRTRNPKRFSHRGYLGRRRRAINRLLNRCPSYLDQQFHSPHNYNDYWGVYNNCYYDQCEHFSPKKSKMDTDFPYQPHYYSKEIESFSCHEYPSKSVDREISSKRNIRGKVTHYNPIYENVSVNSSNDTPSTSRKSLHEKRHNYSNHKTNGILGPKKRKRGNSNSYLESHYIGPEIISFSDKNFSINSASENAAIFVPGGNSTPLAKNFACSEQQKAQDRVPNEVSLAVQNLQLNYLDKSLQEEEITLPLKRINNSTEVLPDFDQKQNLNSDAYSILNNIVSEMGQNENFETKEIRENDHSYKMQPQNSQLLTFPIESVKDETELNVPENQFALLIQQNQTLTDLLSKMINNCDTIKFNSPHQAEIQSFGVNQTEPVQNIENTIYYNNIGDFFYQTEQNFNECLAVDKTTENLNNNSQHFDTPGECFSNLGGGDYQLHILDTENSYDSLDFTNAENFSDIDTALSALTSHILEEPILPPNSLEKIIEDTDETKNKIYPEENSLEKSEIKTVVKKVTSRRRTLSSSNSSTVENKKQVIRESLAKREEPKSVYCDHETKHKSTVDEQTQTVETDKTSRAVGTEEDNLTRNRTLRSTKRDRSSKKASIPRRTRSKCEIPFGEKDVELITTKLSTDTMKSTKQKVPPFLKEISKKKQEHEKCQTKNCEGDKEVVLKCLCSHTPADDTPETYTCPHTPVSERKYDMRRRY